MKELIHKQVINHKGDLVAFGFVTKNIIKQVNDEIKDFNIIATIRFEIFAKKCSKCGKPLEAEECYEYCGRTHCFECKLIKEEVDDECS